MTSSKISTWLLLHIGVFFLHSNQWQYFIYNHGKNIVLTKAIPIKLAQRDMHFSLNRKTSTHK